jgi:hypothetical protein
MRVRRQFLGWLTILGAMVVLAMVSGALTAPVTIALVLLYAFAVGASVIDFRANELIERSRASLSAAKMSPDAREAVERARRRGSVIGAGFNLLDIGLIATATTERGLDMRRTRSVSKDDDGVRPFITLRVAPHQADRTTVVRYEMMDQNGETAYVHEMKTFLRDGDMNILADHQLPLYGNEDSIAAGEWDLRVYVDGSLIAAHSFSVAPSVDERLGRSRRAADAPQQQAARRIATPDASEGPVSLEELLRSQEAEARSSRSSGRRS